MNSHTGVSCVRVKVDKLLCFFSVKACFGAEICAAQEPDVAAFGNQDPRCPLLADQLASFLERGGASSDPTRAG